MSDYGGPGIVSRRERTDRDWECPLPFCPKTAVDWRPPECPVHELEMVPAGTED